MHAPANSRVLRSGTIVLSGALLVAAGVVVYNSQPSRTSQLEQAEGTYQTTSRSWFSGFGGGRPDGGEEDGPSRRGGFGSGGSPHFHRSGG